MKKVLLLLESDNIRKQLIESLTTYQVFTCGPKDAAEVLVKIRPDALVLDLFLPGSDGLAVLESCQSILPPVVLPLSVLITDYIQLKTAQLGAGFVIRKPCSVEYIVSRLEDMLSIQDAPELPDSSRIVDQFLSAFQLHVKPRVQSLLRTAILMTLRDPNCLLTKEIYPALCREYGASQDAVDQAIRRMLRKAWAHKDDNSAVWEEVFPGYIKCPSNGQFISTSALYLRKKYPSRFRKGS